MLVTPPQAESGSAASAPVVTDGATTVDERRASGRIRATLPTKLNGFGLVGTLSCTAIDFGAGGMYVRAPASSGLAVGQRYEVVPSKQDAEGGELAKFVGEGCYATVVRTERAVGAEAPQVGAGLRFDQPLVFWGLPPGPPS